MSDPRLLSDNELSLALLVIRRRFPNAHECLREHILALVEQIDALTERVARLEAGLYEIVLTPLVIRATVPPNEHIPYAQQAINHAEALKSMALAILGKESHEFNPDDSETRRRG